MKNIILGMTTAVSTLSGPVFADLAMNTSTKTHSQSTKPPEVVAPDITPQAEPKITRSVDPFITADFIYWKPVQEGMTYAYPEHVQAVSPTVQAAHKGKVHKPDFEYKAGFKVGAGLKFKHDGWDVYANYTWFNPEEMTDHASKGSNYGLNAGILTDNYYLPFILAASKAEIKWDLDFNILDTELGRSYKISKNLIMRPSFGLKFAWIGQDTKFEYSGAVLSFIGGGTGTKTKVHYHQDDFAIGIRTGLNTIWNFCKHLSAYGDFFISAMWNDFDSNRKDKFDYSTGASVTYVDLDNSSNVLTPVIELALGLRVDTTFHNDDFMFFLQAGWEEQIWMNQSQFFNFQDLGSYNLTFQGLTVKTGFFF